MANNRYKNAQFRKLIYQHYEKAGRSFPWRQPDVGPWGILVSEFMLQQTQTARVVDYWNRWMRLWPKPDDLSNAPLGSALKEWSGLGYNRRCINLRDSAGIIVREYGGIVPREPETLRLLPGIGEYTAGAIACFGYGHPSAFIETNIRTALIHAFFQDRTEVADAELYPILEDIIDTEDPRRFYWALMDYGAALKKAGVNASRRSAQYTRQSPFEGSFRQKRGAVLRALIHSGPASVGQLEERTGFARDDIYEVINTLEKDMLVAEREGIYSAGE